MVTRQEIKWQVRPLARPEIDRIRGQITAKAYEESKLALQDYLCGYFNGEDTKKCDKKQGKNISPVGFSTGGKNGKALKVRWVVPGQGKSGGLRLAVAVYCQEKRVKIAGSWVRKDDPPDADFEEAFKNA